MAKEKNDLNGHLAYTGAFCSDKRAFDRIQALQAGKVHLLNKNLRLQCAQVGNPQALLVGGQEFAVLLPIVARPLRSPPKRLTQQLISIHFLISLSLVSPKF